MRKRTRELNVFSMSFLDAITAGFGCVVLLFMLVSQNALLDNRSSVDNLEAEAKRWELRVLTGQRNLVQIQERLEAQLRDWTALRVMRENLVTEIDTTQAELAAVTQDSAARQAAIERLRAELAALQKESEQVPVAGRPDDEGTRLRSFEGEGNRQYLTGLRMGGKNVVILVDTSTSMLDRTIVNILRRRNMAPAQQRRSPKWQQLVNTVDWLTTQIAPGTQVQVIGFNDKATWLIPGSEGKWVTVESGSELDAPVKALRDSYPQGPTSLAVAFNAIKMLDPKPDNIYLLTDGLPTMGDVIPTREGVNAKDRLDHWDRAVRQLPVGVPVNTILFAMEGDPQAAPAYWMLAIRTGGSMMAPSEDWP
ncbi:MAG TPA: VWA domain-containing protein [Gammaproteobacteria bacterium]|nr:VWA domain-containing protein [Gammaproteobacteria bacterium]